MKKGYDAKLVFDEHDRLVALATGADGVAEHEGGIEELLRALTPCVDSEDRTVRQLRAKGLRKLWQRVRPVRYPDVLDSRRITRYPEALQFLQTTDTDGAREAWLGYCRHHLVNFGHVLQFRARPAGSAVVDEAVGAWDQRGFALRVRGEKYVEALADFHLALCAGKVAFVGKLLRNRGRLSGVILVNTALLSDEERAGLAEAQEALASKLRLRARDDSVALGQEMTRLAGRSPGYVWAVWGDERESAVDYRLNPGYQVNADYSGPYTREQLLDWAASGYGYHLSLHAKAA